MKKKVVIAIIVLAIIGAIKYHQWYNNPAGYGPVTDAYGHKISINID